MGAKDTIQAIALLAFLLFVVLPLGLGAIWLLTAPSATTADALNLVESAAVPWWTGLAQSAPYIFVAIVAVLVWAGADEVLG